MRHHLSHGDDLWPFAIRRFAARADRCGAPDRGVVATLGYALVMGLAFHGAPQAVQQALATFTVMPDPPPPERVVPPPKKINRPSGKASPPNLRSRRPR